MAEHLLNNPVFNALCTGDAAFSKGTDNVKYFDEQVSPFVAFRDEYINGFSDLYELLEPGRKVLYASPQAIAEPAGWKMLAAVEGLQFVAVAPHKPAPLSIKPVALGNEQVPAMLELTALTKPGPFGVRTLEFGNYYGVMEGGQLVAMAGQRLHVAQYTEISAVCTHPDHLGKGYAGSLLQHQMSLIIQQGKIPFLHVRADNSRAIALYERLGFIARSPMNFYFFKKA